MPHDHAAVQMLPHLKRLDRHYGGAWSKQDIDERARDWSRSLSAAPLDSIDAAVQHLIDHHEGNYPKLALVRRLALEHAHRRRPDAEPTAESERCPSCGEMPGWHRIVRRGVVQEIARRESAGVVVNVDAEPHLRPEVERLVTRHRMGFPCQRFNGAYQFAAGEAA